MKIGMKTEVRTTPKLAGQLTIALVLASGLTAPAQQKKTTTTAKPAPPVKQTQAPAARPGVTPPARPGTIPARPGTIPGVGVHPPVTRPSVAHVDPAKLGPGVHPMPGGGRAVVGANGNRQMFDRSGHLTEQHRPGMDARYGANGRPTMVHVERPGGYAQTIHRGPGGVRIAEGFHPALGGGRSRVMAYGPHSGFVERPIYGRPGYYRRSYVVGGRSYAAVYRGYRYHNYEYMRPMPAYVYDRGYYGWAVRSWGAPVRIQVGFAAQPWYGTYGHTFVAYDTYASPDQWMTDQIMAQNMQSAYDAGQAAGPDASGVAQAAPPPVTPEIKEQFDAQVKQEIQDQSQVATTTDVNAIVPPATTTEPEEMPEALKPGHTLFRVVAPIDAQVDGGACTLNADDWIIRNGDMDQSDGTVTVRIAASRATDCEQGATTKVALNDLMTMQNEQDQQIQAAMELASNSMGKSGMPMGPAAKPVQVPGGYTKPDTDVVASLTKEQQDAATNEQAAAAPVAAGAGVQLQ